MHRKEKNMNILTIAREAAAVVSTDQPNTLFDKNNAQSVLFLSLLNDTLESLKRFGDWQQLQKEGAFFITDSTYVYPIDEIAPDFFSLMPDTIYIKDSKEKVIGSIRAEDFVKSKVFRTSNNGVEFYLKGNAFHFVSLPPVGSRVIFQYRSNKVVKAAETENGELVFKERPSKDSDLTLFDPYLVKLSIIWRWYKRNAFAYAEEYQEYLTEVKKAFSEGVCPKDISLVSPCFSNFLGGVHVAYQSKSNG